jgi:endonuclease YncB( thermonuclease family)
MPLAVAGGAALLGGLTRAFSYGFDTTALIATLIAVALLMLAALPFGAGKIKWPPLLERLRWPAAGLPSLPVVRPWAMGVVGAAIIGAFVASYPMGWMSLRPLNLADVIPDVWGADEVISGYAVSLTGDSMRINGKIVHMADIEAPELTQTCMRPDGGSWNCGQVALNALRRLTGNHTVTCQVHYTDESGRRIGKCSVGETDLAAEMVRRGYVFASGALFPAYGSEQAEAQAAKAGLWDGTAMSPQDYRNERWEAASREAPDGCPIKGRVLASGKVYLLPWSRSYETYRVRESRGDRWFCKEDEALSEGWRPYDS